MGAGIAEVSLQKAGHHVILKDNYTTGLARGQDQIFNKYVMFACYDTISAKSLRTLAALLKTVCITYPISPSKQG